MLDLFENKRDLRIVRISELDAKSRSDNFLMLRSKILGCEEMYPAIKTWLDKKVTRGLQTGERVGYVGMYGDEPIASAVVKRGKAAKFCHLKIDRELQDSGLGDIFFALMALEVRSLAGSIHFTLPESLWESKKRFFESFSFNDVIKCNDQYRLFEEELRSEAAYSDVYASVVDKLTRFNGIASIAGFSMDSRLVLSIQPRHAENIMLGRKRVEIRRKFSRDWEGVRFNIYASTPIKALMGEARIERVIEGTPTTIWEHFGTMVGGTKEEFDSYVQGTSTIYALVLGDIKPYSYPVPLIQIEHLIGAQLTAPQSYGVVGHHNEWARAISVAAILQGNAQRKKEAISQIA